jgi:hypothetical protein
MQQAASSHPPPDNLPLESQTEFEPNAPDDEVESISDDEDDEDEFIPQNAESPSDHYLNPDKYEPESALPSMYLDVSMRYAKMKDTEPPPEMRPPPTFKYKNNMSKVVAALGQLLLLVKRHNGTKNCIQTSLTSSSSGLPTILTSLL